MKNNIIKIQSILPGSIAEEAGIELGDQILSINGEKIKDVFDYRFLAANENLTIEVSKEDGEIWEIEIEKDEYEDLGIEFESSMMDEAKNCTNECIFCFIDQLPKGMRDTLYFKDDDSRLSFLTGNYVTLTNMKDDDIDRIIKYKMSPINVSVHTTNPELRVAMLKNRFAGDILKKIKKLVEGGITVNCQIVLCREINDGKELDYSISELALLYPGVNSISVVPVGITRYREGLCNLKPFDKEASNALILQVEDWQRQFLEKFYSRVIYLADEFYILADKDIPSCEHYEDFPQIENGVGLIAMFKHEFEECFESISQLTSPKAYRHITIATGVSAFKFINKMAEVMETGYNNIKVSVFDIKNTFFGENVTVTGLLTGQDIVAQLYGQNLGEELLICRCMLKSGEEIFLDDYTLDMVQEKLKIKVSVVENNGKDFIQKILGN